MKKYHTMRGMWMMAVLWISLLSGACIRDGAQECATTVTFEYTYNMLSADAFGEQVSRVTLYLFDREGVFIRKIHSDPATDVENGFRFELPNLPEAEYQFAAWAQNDRLRNDESSFMVSDLAFGTECNLSYMMRRNNGIQQYELNNLLVGATGTVVAGGGSQREIRVPMKKVNRKIRVIMLPTEAGSELDVANYSFNIIDDPGNGHVNYDFSLLPDSPVTYRPYFAANLTPDPDLVFDPGEVDRAAVAEINTSRLVVENKPRLVISAIADPQPIVDVDLIWLLSLTEMERHQEWTLQEYLDRQDEFVITLFVQGGTWLTTTIIINGWVVNNVDIDI